MSMSCQLAASVALLLGHVLALDEVVVPTPVPSTTDPGPPGGQGCERGGLGPRAKERLGFVTVASSRQYVLAARVLRQSLLTAPRGRDSLNWPRPVAEGCMLMLHTFAMEPWLQSTLLAEGWRLRRAERLANPFDDRGVKQREVFSKLNIWNLEGDFDRIVFFDADMIARKDASAFFACQRDFCATATTRETAGRFNSGLLVLSPNRSLFQELIAASQSPQYSSYNKGDQGFLNAFMPSWCERRRTSSNWEAVVASEPGKLRCASLPGGQEVAAIATHRGEAVLLHYNHPLWWCLKPWTWLAYPLHFVHWEWHNHRRALPDQAAAAQRQCLAAILLPIVLLPLCLRAARRLPELALLPLPCRGTSSREEPEGECAAFCDAARSALLATALAPVLSVLALPVDMDAVAAWLTHFSLKATLALALGLLRRRSRPATAQRLAVAAAVVLAAVALEAALMFVPTLRLGWYWVNERLLHPVCFQGSWMQRNIGCTVLAFGAVFGLPNLASFVVLLMAFGLLNGAAEAPRTPLKDV